ncbi:thioesterase II family protein [Aliikangiella sp. IMCC44359]|uniref:thioesterase II family protein n=1 Tax=Aliikangiella sp. IMCC44359 TaxID=3459125 RepID=UPI00403ABB25
MKSKWFVTPKPNGRAKLRLFCFPYAAGNAATYVPWQEYLPEWVELVAIQPPGRANRIEEQGLMSMEAMVSSLCEAIEPLLDRPYMIFGHSLGSRVGFEFALEVKRRGWREPEHFIASGSNAPHICREHKKIHHLEDKEFVEGLKRFDGPTEVIAENKKLLELFMPMLRADFSVADTYFRTTEEKLDCHFSIYGGKKDTDAPQEQLDTWIHHFSVPVFAIEVFEGDHFFIENNQAAVLNKVVETIKHVAEQCDFNLKEIPETTL